MSQETLENLLRRHVKELAVVIGERNIFRPHALWAAADYIRAEWRAQGYEVMSQAYQAEGVASENLEITRAGRSRPGEILLIGAHYDSVAGSPGANDNGSGVAALLEISRFMAERSPERTVRFVAFVNEEPPFFFWGQMGSLVYAQMARARGDNIQLMMSLEMLGCFLDERGSQSYPPLLRYFYPDRGNFIAFVSNLKSRKALKRAFKTFRARSDFPAESLAAPSFVPGVGWSDQLSFWRQGYRAMMVTDTAFYRYPYYHSGRDRAEQLNYPCMTRVVEGLRETIAELAG